MIKLFSFLRKKKDQEETKISKVETTETAIKEKVLSPGGLSPVISVTVGGVPEKPKDVDRSLIKVKALSKKTTKFKCGHSGPQKAQFILYGESFLFGGKEKVTDSSKCPDCLLKELKETSIQCCLCGAPIPPGRPVALYHKSSEGIKEWATYVNNSAMGCLRWNCAPSGGFFAGHWTKDGFKPAFEKGSTVADQAFQQKSIKIANP